MKNANPTEARGAVSNSSSGDGMSLRKALFRDQHTYGIVITDWEGKIIDWSPAAERIYGYTKDEVVGKTPQIFQPEDRTQDSIADVIAAVERDGYWAGERHIVRKNGTAGVTDTVIFSYQDENGQSLRIGINRDITKGTQIENALRESVERMRMITDNVAAVIIHFDADQCYRFVNDAAVEVLGRPREHIIGQRVTDILDKDFHAILAPYIERALSGEQVTFEGERKAPDGGCTIFQSTYLPQFDEHGQVVGCYLVSVDVTERKRVETEARENEKRLRTITDNVAATIIYFDADERYQFANKAAAEMHGRSPKDIIGRNLREVHGEAEYKLIEPRIREALSGAEVSFEQERLTEDGQRRYYQTTYLPDNGQNGEVVGIYVLLVDITERKLAENILQDDEQRLRLITDNMPANIAYFDADQRVQFVNKGVEELHGLSRDQIIGKRAYEFQSKDAYRDLGPKIERALAGEEVVFEQTRVAADGSLRHFQSTYLPHIDDQGRILGCYGLSVDITERMQAEAELKENAVQLRTITDNMPANVMYFDPDQRIRFVNKGVEELHGVPREEIIGKRACEFQDETTFRELGPKIERALNGEEVVFEQTRIAHDGTPRNFQSVYLPHVDEQGQVLGCYGLWVDITERMRAEAELKENEVRLRTITDNIGAHIVYFDADERYQFINEANREIYGLPREEIIGKTLLEIQGEEVYDQVRPHVQRALAGEEVVFEQVRTSLDGRVIHFATTYLPDIDQSGEVQGVYVLLVDVTDRKQAETVLQDNEQRLRLITDNMPANVIYFDIDERYRFVNKRVEEYYGIPVDDIIGRSAKDIQGDVAYTEIGPQIKNALAGEEVVFEQTRTAGDGTTRHFQSTYLPHFDERGRVLGCYALSVDITGRTLAEAELKENENRLRLITDNVGAMITYLDTDKRYSFVNKAFADMLGLSQSEIVGRLVKDLQDEETYRQTERYIDIALHGEEASFERTRTGGDGITRSFLSTYLPHFDDSGDVVGVYGLSVDITERKRAEMVARENEARLRLVTDNVAGNIFYIDADRRYQFVNKNTEEMFGLPREDIIGKTVDEIQSPEVVAQLEPFTEAALSGQEVKFELDRTGPDGSVRTYQSTGIPHFAENGDVLGYYVLTVDITERKFAETTAKENEARLRLITDNIAATIVYFDADRRYQFVNKTIEALHGMPGDELIGKPVRDVMGESGYQEIKQYMDAALAGEQATFEQVRTRPDGSQRTYHSTYLPHIDESGEVLGCYALLVDITERVNAEGERQANEQQLRLITDNLPGHFIYFDMDLNYRFVNKAVLDLFGLEREDIIGKHTIEIQGDVEYRKVEPYFKRALAGEQVSFQQRRTSVDGVSRDYQSTYLPHFGDDGVQLGFYLISIDVTERMRAEEELKQQTRAADLLRKIAVAANHADSADEAIQVSLDELCAYSNWPIGHAYLLSNDGSEELSSTNLWHMDNPDRFEPFRRDTERMTFQAGVGLPGRVVSDTSAHWMTNVEAAPNYPRSYVAQSVGIVTGFAIPVMVGRQVAAVLEFFTDAVIERDDQLLSIAEQVGVLVGRVIERQRTERSLLDAKEEAEVASRAKSEFLANMSHELRTPLNAIIGFSEIINDETLGAVGNPAYREYAGHIYDSGQHLLTLINDILDISKIETGNAPLHEERVDVVDVINSCMVMVRERADAGGLTLSIDTPDTPLPQLYADARRIKQVIINLASNAVKFTEAGGSVTVKAWYNSDSGFVIQVRDTGIGIEVNDIPKALGRFQQVDSDLNRKYEGTGLGLPLAKALIEQHGGSLNLQSRVGVGTTVTVRLPAERALPAAE